MKGGKARPSRSIKQIFDLFKGQKSGFSVAKRLFRHAEAPLLQLTAAGELGV